MRRPALTCEAVLAEAAFHLRNPGIVVAMVDDGLLRVAFDVGANTAQLRALAKRYRDRAPDLADLCLIRMSELHPRHVILTVDAVDFRGYRRNKRDVIPCVFPS